MRTLAVLVLCVGCVDGASTDKAFNKELIVDIGNDGVGQIDIPEAPECSAENGACLGGTADTAVRNTNRVGETSTVVVDPVFVGCTATAQVAASAAAGSCGANLSVHVDCAAHAQKHDSFQLGVMVDGVLSSQSARRYTCGETISQSFDVPCDATSVVGIAVFDHPFTGVDTACVSDPL